MRVQLVFVTIILLHHAFCSGNNGSPFLKFKTIDSITERQDYFPYYGSRKPINVDGTSPQVLIRVLETINAYPPTLRFHCIVETLSPNYLLKRADLCILYHHSTKEHCESAKSGFLHADSNKFTATGSPSTGYIFESNWTRGSSPLDAIYFCRLANDNGVIESQTIEIQDVEFYTSKYLQQAPMEHVLRGPFVGSDFPVSLDCGDPFWSSVELPNWAKENFQSPFEWVYCDVKAGSTLDLHTCYEKAIPSYDPLSSFFETTVQPNGTLIIHQRTSVPWRPIGILCVSRIIAKRVFAAYFQGDNGKAVPFQYIPGDYGEDLITPKSLQSVSKDYRAGRYAKGSVELTALYTANPANTKTVWTKNGGPLPILFEKTDHSLIFPEVITPADSGNYSLTVTGPNQHEVFTFNVLVNAPPKVRRSAPRSVYVLEGQPVQIETEFEGRLTSRSVSINGILIDTLSTVLFEESLRHLRDQFPYIDGLYPEIEFPSDTSIRYTLRDITSSPNAPYGASHSVTLTGTNTLGGAHTHTVIRVLSPPRITRLMADSSCEDDCFNGTSHRFHCDVDLAPYAGLNVVKTWEFDGRDLEALHQMDPLLTFLKIAGNEVILSIVADNATFDRLFASAELSCRFRIYAPEEVELFGANAMEPIYDTKNSPELHKLLTAVIRKNPSSGAPLSSFASLSWIAAVVIAVMILLAVIILAVCVVMRNKGRTYLLDREERALGNDPEKEFRDRDNFRVLERSENVPVPGCNISLDDKFQVAGSDDEGELDSYGMDPGNFNETGSFINEYSNHTQRKPNVIPTTSVGPV
ncbi:hypothetical protein AAHC03_05505 [Spirometra sp. Aus1]